MTINQPFHFPRPQRELSSSLAVAPKDLDKMSLEGKVTAINSDPKQLAREKLINCEAAWLNRNISEEELCKLPAEIVSSNLDINEITDAARFVLLCGYVRAHAGKAADFYISDNAVRMEQDCLKKVLNVSQSDVLVWKDAGLKLSHIVWAIRYSDNGQYKAILGLLGHSDKDFASSVLRQVNNIWIVDRAARESLLTALFKNINPSSDPRLLEATLLTLCTVAEDRAWLSRRAGNIILKILPSFAASSPQRFDALIHPISRSLSEACLFPGMGKDIKLSYDIKNKIHEFAAGNFTSIEADLSLSTRSRLQKLAESVETRVSAKRGIVGGAIQLFSKNCSTALKYFRSFALKREAKT